MFNLFYKWMELKSEIVRAVIVLERRLGEYSDERCDGSILFRNLTHLLKVLLYT